MSSPCGVGIPGRLDRDRSKVLSAGFVNVAGIPLGEVLSARIGRPVVLDNDGATWPSSESSP